MVPENTKKKLLKIGTFMLAPFAEAIKLLRCLNRVIRSKLDCKHLLTQTIRLQLKLIIKNRIISWFNTNDTYIEHAIFLDFQVELREFIHASGKK